MLLELHEKRELDDTDDFIDKHQYPIINNWSTVELQLCKTRYQILIRTLVSDLRVNSESQLT